MAYEDEGYENERYEDGSTSFVFNHLLSAMPCRNSMVELLPPMQRPNNDRVANDQSVDKHKKLH